MTLAYFVVEDKIVNPETLTYAEVIGRTDAYNDAHVIAHFVGGDYLEFSPGVTLHEFYNRLNERSSDD